MSDRPHISIAKRGRPSKEEAGDRRERFLVHALEQFSTLGYRATTLDGLAASFGASKATVYRQYGSKAGLLLATMYRGVSKLAQPLEAVSTDPARLPADVLHDFAHVLRTYQADAGNRAMWQAVSEARMELGEELNKVIDFEAEALAPITAYLAREGARGRLKVGDPHVAASCFADLVNGGLTSFLASPAGKPAVNLLGDYAVELFLNGVLQRDTLGSAAGENR